MQSRHPPSSARRSADRSGDGSSHSTPKPDPYLVTDTQMTTPAIDRRRRFDVRRPARERGDRRTYPARNSNATIAGYQAVGSGAGETDLLNLSTFNWGGTDVPMAQTDIAQTSLLGRATRSVQFAQVPIGLGGEAIDYNLPGFKTNVHLKLTAAIIAGIYNGTITKWNAPQIKKLEPQG